MSCVAGDSHWALSLNVLLCCLRQSPGTVTKSVNVTKSNKKSCSFSWLYRKVYLILSQYQATCCNLVKLVLYTWQINSVIKLHACVSWTQMGKTVLLINKVIQKAKNSDLIMCIMSHSHTRQNWLYSKGRRCLLFWLWCPFEQDSIWIAKPFGCFFDKLISHS